MFWLNHFANTGVTNISGSSFNFFWEFFSHNYLEFSSTSGETVQEVGLLVEIVTLVEVPSAVLRTVARVTAPQAVNDIQTSRPISTDNKAVATAFSHFGASAKREMNSLIKSFILFVIRGFTMFAIHTQTNERNKNNKRKQQSTKRYDKR